MKHHYIKETVTDEKISLVYCLTKEMTADIHTKSLGHLRFATLTGPTEITSNN